MDLGDQAGIRRGARAHALLGDPPDLYYGLSLRPDLTGRGLGLGRLVTRADFDRFDEVPFLTMVDV